MSPVGIELVLSRRAFALRLFFECAYIEGSFAVLLARDMSSINQGQEAQGWPDLGRI